MFFHHSLGRMSGAFLLPTPFMDVVRMRTIGVSRSNATFQRPAHASRPLTHNIGPPFKSIFLKAALVLPSYGFGLLFCRCHQLWSNVLGLACHLSSRHIFADIHLAQHYIITHFHQHASNTTLVRSNVHRFLIYHYTATLTRITTHHTLHS